MAFTCALHTYFAVSSIDKVHGQGLMRVGLHIEVESNVSKAVYKPSKQMTFMAMARQAGQPPVCGTLSFHHFSQVRVEGLDGVAYTDSLQGGKRVVQEGPVVNGAEVDRIYVAAPDSIKVRLLWSTGLCLMVFGVGAGRLREGSS